MEKNFMSTNDVCAIYVTAKYCMNKSRFLCNDYNPRSDFGARLGRGGRLLDSVSRTKLLRYCCCCRRMLECSDGFVADDGMGITGEDHTVDRARDGGDDEVVKSSVSLSFATSACCVASVGILASMCVVGS